MSAHRYKSTWRSITFNEHYDDSGLVDDPAHLVAAKLNSHIRLESLDVTAVTTQDFREIRQHLEGAESNEAFEGVRVLTGRGRIIAATPADLEDKTWAMFEAFSPAACRMAARSLDPAGVIPFDFKRDSAGGAKALRFWCRPSVGRPVIVGRMKEGLVRPFQFQLVALDPFAYEQSETQSFLTLGGQITVNNPGNVYTRPRFRIGMLAGAGSATFMIQNQTTADSLVLDLSGAASQILIVDTAKGIIYNNSTGASVYGYRVSGYASALVLAPGNNTLAVSNATNVDYVRCDRRGAFA